MACSKVLSINGAGNTSTTVTASENPVPVQPPFVDGVTLTATVIPALSVGTVSFYDGATLLGTSSLTGGIATLGYSTWNPAGVHSVTAVFSGSGIWNPSTSPAYNLTVGFPNLQMDATGLQSLNDIQDFFGGPHFTGLLIYQAGRAWIETIPFALGLQCQLGAGSGTTMQVVQFFGNSVSTYSWIYDVNSGSTKDPTGSYTRSGGVTFFPPPPPPPIPTGFFLNFV